jgi:hypothetical protein
VYRVRHTQSAEACYEVLTVPQRRRILQVINSLLANDPDPDELRKFAFPELGARYALYVDPSDPEGYWVLYAVDPSAGAVVIVGVGVSGRT